MSGENKIYLGKKGGTRGKKTGKWHLFPSNKKNAKSICGTFQTREMHTRLKLKQVQKDIEKIKQKTGLGKLCEHCREYLAGYKNQENLPRKTQGSDKHGTKINILDTYD